MLSRCGFVSIFYPMIVMLLVVDLVINDTYIFHSIAPVISTCVNTYFTIGPRNGLARVLCLNRMLVNLKLEAGDHTFAGKYNSKYRFIYMMTSSNGNIFRVTGSLCWEFTGPGWFPHKGQWRRALMFSLICVWLKGWVNNREAGGLIHYRAHYDVIVMKCLPHGIGYFDHA